MSPISPTLVPWLIRTATKPTVVSPSTAVYRAHAEPSAARSASTRAWSESSRSWAICNAGSWTQRARSPPRSVRSRWTCSCPAATILEVLWPIAHGPLNEFGRRRSFHGDCTSSHPFVVPLPFGKRSGCLGTGNLARNHSLRPSCETKLVPIRLTSLWDRSRRIHDTPRTEQGPHRSWLAPRSIQSPQEDSYSSTSSYQR